MAKDIKVPLLGNMPRGAVLAGGLAVVGVGGYLLWKHYQNKNTPPTGAYAYGYGANAYGYGSNVPYGYGYGYGQYSPYGTGGFGGGFGGWPGYYGYTGQQQQQQITTNAQWGQAAEAAMGSTGNDAIAAAIAKYLFAATLDETQAQTVQEAIAVVGYPPVPGPGNFPPQMHVSKGKKKDTKVTVPNVVGMETGAGVRAIRAKGLTASHPKLETGVGSTITAENPPAGTQVKNGSNVALSIKEKEKGRGHHVGQGGR